MYNTCFFSTVFYLTSFDFFNCFLTSIVTVPVLGLGIKPLGPNTRPSLPTSPIISGVATTTSKSNQPCWIFVRNLLAYIICTCFFSFSDFIAFSENSTRCDLPVPCGNTTAPRICWSFYVYQFLNGMQLQQKRRN